MKAKSRVAEQDDLLRPRLTDMIDMRHALVKLAELIDWECFEREWAGFFPSEKGRPATPSRLVAGLMYLQHAFSLSMMRWSPDGWKTPITSTSPARHSFSIARRSMRPR